MRTLILIDSNALIYKCFYALPKLTTPEGEPIGAVYGFTSIILKILREFKPDYIAAAFDMKAPTFRHKEYKEYKAQRPKAPQELYDQIPKAKETLSAFQIPVFEKEEFEADDLIGTIAEEADENYSNLKIIILTGDLDTLQLVKNEKITVYALKKGITDIHIYDEKAIKAQYGINPKQLIDYKGLRGDPSDNIPGVKGIGEKTALELIKKFGSIEKIYEEIKKENETAVIKDRVKELLLAGEKDARLAKHLCAINKEAPIKFDLEQTKLKTTDSRKITELFERFGFQSLIPRLDKDYQPKYNQSKLF